MFASLEISRAFRGGGLPACLPACMHACNLLLPLSLSLSLYLCVSLCVFYIRARVNYMCTLDDTRVFFAFEIVNDRVQNFIISQL